MNTDIKLSTKFHQAQGAHEVGMLVTLAGEVPVQRPRINVALVLDRSGSMGGPPLAAAKQALIRFATCLAPQDHVTIAVFDHEASLIYGPGPADHDAIRAAVARIHYQGNTNLSGGWLLGRQHVLDALGDGTNRVVLFTDGCANEGITDATQLTNLARGAAEGRVSTTCIGFGPEFNEDLLRAMANAGSGNYWYIQNTDQMGGTFDDEIEGLVALAAQNVSIEVRASHPKVQGVTFPQSLAISRTADGGWLANIGDLYATTPRSLGVILHVEDVGTLSETRLAEVKVTADVLTPQGVEHRVITMPVVANISGNDQLEPTVDSTLLRYAAAKAREEAMKVADRGDLPGAAELLERASESLRACKDQESIDESADLRQQAVRLRESGYDLHFRKRNYAASFAVSEGKREYLRRLRKDQEQ